MLWHIYAVLSIKKAITENIIERACYAFILLILAVSFPIT